MKSIKHALWAAATFSILTSAAAWSQEQPTMGMLPCKGKCAAYTNAKGIDYSIPTFPPQQANGYVDGYIVILITIGTDGRVHDPKIMQMIGPQAFIQHAKSALAKWTFKPATLDGVPIESSMPVAFRFVSRADGARNGFLTVYNGARKLMADGKRAEAYEQLKALMEKPDWNFYERGTAASTMALIALEGGDPLDARELLSIGYEDIVDTFPDPIHIAIHKLRIQASLATGDLVGAHDGLEKLKKIKRFDASDPIVDLVAQSVVKAESMSVVASKVRIPLAHDAEEDGAWASIGLFRRHFGFGGISGALDKLFLRCDQKTVESSVSDQAEWHVPENWSNCFLFVHGKSGTTFDVLQANQ